MSNRSSGIWIFLFVIGLVLGIWLNIYYYYDRFAYPSIIGIIWFVGGLVILGFIDVKKTKALPLLTDYVTIISKVIEEDEQYAGNGTTTTYTHYWVVFEFSDNSNETIEVQQNEYDGLNEGDRGVLNYKRYKDGALLFLNFEINVV